MNITIDDEIGAIKREINYRHRVYPRLIAEEKMTRADADRQIAIMRTVLARLEGVRAERSPALPGL